MTKCLKKLFGPSEESKLSQYLFLFSGSAIFIFQTISAGYAWTHPSVRNPIFPLSIFVEGCFAVFILALSGLPMRRYHLPYTFYLLAYYAPSIFLKNLNEALPPYDLSSEHPDLRYLMLGSGILLLCEWAARKLNEKEKARAEVSHVGWVSRWCFRAAGVAMVSIAGNVLYSCYQDLRSIDATYWVILTDAAPMAFFQLYLATFLLQLKPECHRIYLICAVELLWFALMYFLRGIDPTTSLFNLRTEFWSYLDDFSGSILVFGILIMERIFRDQRTRPGFKSPQQRIN